MDFKTTPSFYENNEQFIKYLGQTSFYKQLQNCVLKTVKLAKPKSILELGFGNGNTTINVAKIMDKDVVVQGLDIREEMKTIAENNAKEQNITNIEFIVDDMVEYINTVATLPDFTFALYSFHHIEDPLEKKVEFLKTCKEKMKKGSYFCIAETFLPEGSHDISKFARYNELYAQRTEETYHSVFWSALKSLNKEDIEYASCAGKYASEAEYRAGQLVINRDNEYLVNLNWLKNVVEEIGFDIKLMSTCNIVGDAVILIQNN